MSNTLGKNLQNLYSSLIKKPKPQITNSDHRRNTPQRPRNPTYTKNYNSLFENITLSPLTIKSVTSSIADTDTDKDMTDAVDPDTPDLTGVYASGRFFISSPGRSNSIIDSPSSATEEEVEPPFMVVDGVAIETYSPNPYMDFRRSMTEMVAARGVAREDVNEIWQYLLELLLSYLSLNPKSTHKYIIRAYADFVVGNMCLSYVKNSDISSSSSPFNNISKNRDI